MLVSGSEISAQERAEEASRGKGMLFDKVQEKIEESLNAFALTPHRNATSAAVRPAEISQAKKMNVQVIRRPGGAWEKLQDGGKGRQFWKMWGGGAR